MPGTYTVTVTNPANGCTASASVTVIRNVTPPNGTVNPSNGQITCTVNNLNLTAFSTTPGATYLWSTSATTTVINVTAAGTYTVTVTNPANGCTVSSSGTVTQVTNPPNVNVTQTGTLTCTSGSVLLTASSTTAGVTYNWGGGNTTPTDIVTSAGTYTVTVTNPANNCTASFSITVTSSIAPPNAAINPPGFVKRISLTSVTLISKLQPQPVLPITGGVEISEQIIQ